MTTVQHATVAEAELAEFHRRVALLHAERMTTTDRVVTGFADLLRERLRPRGEPRSHDG